MRTEQGRAFAPVAGETGQIGDKRVARRVRRLNSVDLPTFGRPMMAMASAWPVIRVEVGVMFVVIFQIGRRLCPKRRPNETAKLPLALCNPHLAKPFQGMVYTK